MIAYVTKRWTTEGITTEEGQIKDNYFYLRDKRGFSSILVVGRDVFVSLDDAVFNLVEKRKKLILAHEKKLAKLDKLIRENA